MIPGPKIAQKEREFWTPENTVLSASRLTEVKKHLTSLEHEAEQWRALNTSYWLREHVARGNIGKVQGRRALQICNIGLTYAIGTHRRSQRNNAQPGSVQNVIAEGNVFRWLSTRESGTLDEVLDTTALQIRKMARNIVLRLQKQEAVADDGKDIQDIRSFYGSVFELTTVGALLESSHFRKQRIIPLVASPVYESRSTFNPVPSDVLMLRINEDDSTDVVGGIQCKASTSLRRRNVSEDPYVGFVVASEAGSYDYLPAKSSIIHWLESDSSNNSDHDYVESIAHRFSPELKEALQL